MRYTVKMRGVVIGHSELPERDAVDRRARGPFRPGFGWELVQPIFQLYGDAVRSDAPRDVEKLERYHAARDKLGLVLVDAGGREIATSGIHIVEHGEGDLALEVLVRDDRFWPTG